MPRRDASSAGWDQSSPIHAAACTVQASESKPWELFVWLGVCAISILIGGALLAKARVVHCGEVSCPPSHEGYPAWCTAEGFCAYGPDRRNPLHIIGPEGEGQRSPSIEAAKEEATRQSQAPASVEERLAAVMSAFRVQEQAFSDGNWSVYEESYAPVILRYGGLSDIPREKALAEWKTVLSKDHSYVFYNHGAKAFEERGHPVVASWSYLGKPDGLNSESLVCRMSVFHFEDGKALIVEDVLPGDSFCEEHLEARPRLASDAAGDAAAEEPKKKPRRKKKPNNRNKRRRRR